MPKKNHLLNLLISILLMPCSLYAYGGGADTGGVGDYGKQKVYSWYPRSNPSYCVEVESDFGLSADQADLIVREALAKWEQYVRNRSTPYWSEMRFKKNERCTGGTTIRFALGKMPSLSTAELFAKAELHKYDPETEIGAGTIWVRNEAGLPNFISWKKASNLLAVLIHEVGHTLGVEHITGTIMDEALSTWIESANSQDTPKLIEEIGLRYELLPSSITQSSTRICRKRRYVGLYQYSADTPPHGFDEAISQLIGRPPENDWRMTIDNDCRSFVYRDAAGEHRGSIQLVDVVATFPSPGEIFVKFNMTTFVAWGAVQSVRIVMDNGRSADALIRTNAQPSPFSIDLFEAGKKLPLFRAASPWEIQHERLDLRYGIQYSVE